MQQVHKFMDLGKSEVDYFISQVGLAAESFGVTKDDVTAVANSLNSIFNVACGPPTTAIKAQGPQLQSICIDQETCPKANDSQCALYAAAVEPANATSSMMSSGTANTATSSGTSTGSATTGSATTGSSSMPSSGAAVHNGFAAAAAAAGFAAFLL